MILLQEFSIILAISFAGEALSALLPLPVPASVYGLVLMLTALCTGLIKPAQVRRASSLLLELMPIMFVPVTVGVTEVWPQLAPVCLPFLLTCAVSTVVVMGLTGKTTQIVLDHEGRGSRA